MTIVNDSVQKSNCMAYFLFFFCFVDDFEMEAFDILRFLLSYFYSGATTKTIPTFRSNRGSVGCFKLVCTIIFILFFIFILLFLLKIMIYRVEPDIVTIVNITCIF